MNKKIKIILPIVFIALIALAIIIYFVANSKKEDINLVREDPTNDKITVEDLKEEYGATADEDIYVVSEESDGRKILAINPNLEYKVALAGILTNQQPVKETLDEEIKNAPQNDGIWISEKSREKFLQMLNECTQGGEYSITEEGYLKIDKKGENNIDIGIEQMINSEKLYLIDVTGRTYIVDYITGDIVEEPFEKMDPYATYEYFEEENSIIVVLTTNSNGLLTTQEIIQSMIDLCNN